MERGQRGAVTSGGSSIVPKGGAASFCNPGQCGSPFTSTEGTYDSKQADGASTEKKLRAMSTLAGKVG